MISYDEKLERIAHYYGLENQSHQLVEEMAELVKALNKVWRCTHERGRKVPDYFVHDDTWEDVAEEMADVYICLHQVEKLMCEKNARMASYMQKYYGAKIDREIERITMKERVEQDG